MRKPRLQTVIGIKIKAISDEFRWLYIALLLNRRGGAGPTAALAATTEDVAEVNFASRFLLSLNNLIVLSIRTLLLSARADLKTSTTAQASSSRRLLSWYGQGSCMVLSSTAPIFNRTECHRKSADQGICVPIAIPDCIAFAPEFHAKNVVKNTKQSAIYLTNNYRHIAIAPSTDRA